MTQAPASQACPSGQFPHEPPQLSSPHASPLHFGTQFLAKHWAQSDESVFKHRRFASSHVSALHSEASSQGADVLTHLPSTNRSSPLQKTPSEHVSSTLADSTPPNAGPFTVGCHESWCRPVYRDWAGTGRGIPRSGARCPHLGDPRGANVTIDIVIKRQGSS
jgi:hypothetical protein